MNLRSKLALGVAAIALVGGLAVSSQAANPAAPAIPAAPAATQGTPVTAVPNADKTLIGAQVKDSKGEAIGEVKSVKVDAGGKVASVEVAMGDKTVSLQANSLTYAQAENTVTSSQTKAEIQSMK